ncbi:MAG: hypothetical protein K2G52_12910 [Muribaculaceae bacterium]|nr:hypothetical protein [Muribaculaceae bacterium]
MTKSIKQKITRLAAPVLMSVMFAGAACSSDECLDNKNSLPLAGFYSSAELPQQITLDSISIYGIGAPGDSVLHDSVRGLSQSYLPFRIDEGETKYVIKYLSGLLGRYGIADTITFRYEIQPWFVSAACGAVYYYNMDTILTTRHVIDSVTCPSGQITNVSTENLRIYFRVSSEGEE